MRVEGKKVQAGYLFRQSDREGIAGVTSELRLKEVEDRPSSYLEEEHAGRENSQCKGPEPGLAHVKSSEGATGAHGIRGDSRMGGRDGRREHPVGFCRLSKAFVLCSE